MKNKLILLFFGILTIEIWADISGNLKLVWLTKPLLIPILIYIYYRFKSFKINISLILALLFSLLGDILLMFRSENLFIPGLISFAIAHAYYIKVFFNSSKPISKKTMILFAIVSAYFIYLLPHLPKNLVAPVLGYCLVISCMGAITINIQKENKNYYYLEVGAILFILSDALIAFNKFVEALPFSALFVMLTYGVAQLLLVLGFLKEEKKIQKQ
jgi:uncharacterized membrane protein YhhN